MENDEKTVAEETEEEDLDLSDLEDIDIDDEDETEEEEGKETEESNETASEKDEKSEKKKQSAEENSRFAKMRRENKKLQQELERLKAEKDKADFKGKANAISKSVLEDLGIDEIKTEDDMFLAKAYEEAESDGSDNPALDAHKALLEKNRKEKQQAESEKESQLANQKKIDEDVKSFVDKFGKEAYESDIKNKDSSFWKLFDGKVGYGELTKTYETYMEVMGKAKSSSDGKRKGAIPSSERHESPDTSDTVDVSKMSAKEFDKYWKAKYSR